AWAENHEKFIRIIKCQHLHTPQSLVTLRYVIFAYDYQSERVFGSCSRTLSPPDDSIAA
ncbi:hypothetical protein IG631_23680, partial [Alternaria alternata]